MKEVRTPPSGRDDPDRHGRFAAVERGAYKRSCRAESNDVLLNREVNDDRKKRLEEISWDEK